MGVIGDLILGIVTSIGGFVEVGSISTSAQAGSEFGLQLLWAVAAAGVMLAMLVEMSGRLAAVSKRPLAGAVRDRFGLDFQIIPLSAELVVDVLLLAAEIGGASIAVKMLTGVGFLWWVVPVGGVAWLVLRFLGFGLIEYGIGLLGLVTLCFVVSAFKLGPSATEVGRSLLPSLPTHDHTRYAFIAVSIVGATVSPYPSQLLLLRHRRGRHAGEDLWVDTTTRTWERYSGASCPWVFGPARWCWLRKGFASNRSTPPCRCSRRSLVTGRSCSSPSLSGSGVSARPWRSR